MCESATHCPKCGASVAHSENVQIADLESLPLWKQYERPQE